MENTKTSTKTILLYPETEHIKRHARIERRVVLFCLAVAVLAVSFGRTSMQQVSVSIEVSLKGGKAVSCEQLNLGVFERCSDGFSYPQSEVSKFRKVVAP